VHNWHRLPDFPWDSLEPFRVRAAEASGGVVDLSVGTPVDPTPTLVADALIAHANAPGYPTTAGLIELRTHISRWLETELGGIPGAGILPTIGSKEAVATLPWQLGIGAGDVVVIPRIAYPTYAVGAIAAGAEVIATDTPEEVSNASLIWLNSPGNPTGDVMSAGRLREVITYARSRNIPLLSDECYIELGWDAEPVSALHPDANGGSLDGIVVLHSLSKRSNLAGYRFGHLAGDPSIIATLLERRKHLGSMVPLPVQHAAAAAYADQAHVSEQRARYARRRELLKAALTASGFTIESSAAGLYLWITRGEPCWETVGWFADRGIVVTPGDFYGEAGANHVRVALTATDAHVDLAVQRLT
jgi:succinyldiaminopimelate transaminase